MEGEIEREITGLECSADERASASRPGIARELPVRVAMSCEKWLKERPLPAEEWSRRNDTARVIWERRHRLRSWLEEARVRG